MDEPSVEASFLLATAAEKKRRSINYERRRRDIGLELLKKRQKVTTILGNDQFRAELEGILKTHLGGGEPPRRPRQFHDIDERQPDTTSALGNVPRRSSYYGSVAMGNHIIPINDLRGVSGSKYTIAEKQLRCKLASLYRLVDWLGWGESIYNHITVKVSQEKEHFLINPFGLLYSEVTASNLLKIDLHGNILDPGTTQLGCNLAGYMLHSAIHEGRPEIQCIIHVHTGPGAGVSAMSCGLLPISQEALSVGGVSYHDYHGILVDEGEKEEIIRNLGPINKVMILRNHGLVALGSTIEEAFDYLYNLVLACESQIRALSCGIANLILVSKEVGKRVQDVVTQGGGGVSKNGKMWRRGELEYEAFMRMLDNMGYKTGYPYKGMEMLQPAETTDNKRQSLQRRKGSQSKETRTGKSTNSDNSTLKEKTMLQSSEKELPLHLITIKEGTEHEMKESHLTDSGGMLSTIMERQEPVAVAVSPPSSAVDDVWDFLNDSPQKVAIETTNQQGHDTLRNTSDGLWNFLDDDTVSPDMPARVANSTSSSGSVSRRSSDDETNLPQQLTDAERNSVELTARHVANTTSEAVKTLASRTDANGLSRKATSKDTIGSQEAHILSTDRDSSTTAHETIPMNDLAGLHKVVVTAERVAASTGGAVLKLGSSFYHQ